MHKDKVWEKLKNDESKVYNKPILSIFLSIIEYLQPNHFLEIINSDHINDLNDIIFFKFLRHNDNLQIAGSGWRVEKIVDKILSNKENISEDLIYWILVFCPEDEIEKISNNLGNKIKKISYSQMFDVIEKNIKNIKLMSKIFGDKLREMPIQMILDLITYSFRVMKNNDEEIDKVIDSFGGLENLIIRIINDMPKMEKVGWGFYLPPEPNKDGSMNGWRILRVLLDRSDSVLYNKIVKYLIIHSRDKEDFEFILYSIMKHTKTPNSTFNIIRKLLGNKIKLNSENVINFINELLDNVLDYNFEITYELLKMIDIKKIVEDLGEYGDEFIYEVRRYAKMLGKRKDLANLILKYIDE